MYLKHAFGLMINNANVLIKTFVFNIIIITFCLLSIHFVVVGSLSTIAASAELKAFTEAVKTSVKNILQGNFSKLQDLTVKFEALINVFNSNRTSLIIGGLAILFILFAASYLHGISKYTMCAIVNGYMSSISRLTYMQTMFVNLKKSALFELLFTFINFIAVIILLAVSVLLAIYTINFLSVFSVILSSWLFFMGVSLVLTVTTHMRPASVNGAGFMASFGVKPEKKEMLNIFSGYLVSIVLLFSFNVILILTTLGAGALISVSVTSLYTVCMQLVIFYTLDGRKYYMDFDHIITPKKLRTDDAKYLEDI